MDATTSKLTIRATASDSIDVCLITIWIQADTRENEKPQRATETAEERVARLAIVAVT